MTSPRLSPHDPSYLEARREAHQHGPIAAILDEMNEAGYWVKPGPGYNPKYRSTVWALILLAQLGASLAADPRIETACSYLLDHSLNKGGQFSYNGPPSGTIDCLQGNLCWALLEMGCQDPRLDTALDWMARSVTGEGIAAGSEAQAERRYYAAKCGPIFACGANDRLSCAWGGVKVMLAFSKLPPEKRTAEIESAIQTGLDFFFSTDPLSAAYPTPGGNKPNRAWWSFGFPVFYITDLLQLAEALVNLGCASDPRLASTLELIRQKGGEAGRWNLEYDYAGKTWVDFGPKKQPNPWVTLRALRILKTAQAA